MKKTLEQQIENLHKNIGNNLVKTRRDPEYVNSEHQRAINYLSGFFFSNSFFDKFAGEYQNITSNDEKKEKINFWEKYPDFFKDNSYEQRQEHFAYFLDKVNDHPRDKDQKYFFQDICPKLEGMMFAREWFSIETGCQQSGFNGLNRHECIKSLTQSRETMDLAEDFYKLHSSIRLNRIEPEIRRKANESFHSTYYGIMCKIYSNIADSIKDKSIPKEWAENHNPFNENSPWGERKNKIWIKFEKSPDLFLRLIKSFQEHYKITPNESKYLERINKEGYINWCI